MSQSPESVALAFVNAINRQDVDALMELISPEHRFVDSLGNMVEPNPNAKEVYGRMVGVAVAADGSLLISDDGSGVIWRVQYIGG